MRVHFVGLGKLGLPVALALEAAGHDLTGWDVSEQRRRDIEARRVPEEGHEAGLTELLATTRLRLVERVPTDAEIVLIAVQTPHKPEFEGATPLERGPEDFDYTALRSAVQQVANDVRDAGSDPLVVVISTCLPGTFGRDLRAMLAQDIWTFTPVGRAAPTHAWRERQQVRFAYHPLFIAMGQVISDFRNPEFVLVGTDDGAMPDELLRLYDPLYEACPDNVVWRAPIRCMSITSAELTKVAYNVWLGYKLMLANGLAELSDKVGANVDDVLGTLKLATDRLVSTRYMNAGMGDGGGCHPRDAVALSSIARRVGLSHDTFAVVIRAREEHARWLAGIWCDAADESGLPMVLLGREFKANTWLTTGSHARMVEHYARGRGREPALVRGPSDLTLPPYTPKSVADLTWPPPRCYFLGAAHDWILASAEKLRGVLVDPWGIVAERGDLKVIRPGRRA